MKNEQLKKLIKEEIKNILEDTMVLPPVLTQSLEKLGIDINKFKLAFTQVKLDKSLNINHKSILADIMVALLKSKDDSLLLKIFTQLKQMGTEAPIKSTTSSASSPIK